MNETNRKTETHTTEWCIDVSRNILEFFSLLISFQITYVVCNMCSIMAYLDFTVYTFCYSFNIRKYVMCRIQSAKTQINLRMLATWYAPVSSLSVANFENARLPTWRWMNISSDSCLFALALKAQIFTTSRIKKIKKISKKKTKKKRTKKKKTQVTDLRINEFLFLHLCKHYWITDGRRPTCTVLYWDSTVFLNEMIPVVQSIVSLTSSLRGQIVKCFMTLLPNTLIFFVEKMREAFALQKLLTFLQQKILANLKY